MSETVKNVTNTESSDEALGIELIQDETANKKTMLKYIKSILKWIFFFIMTFLFGGNILLKICHYIANILNSDYSVIWKNILLFLLCGISFNLYRVRADTPNRHSFKLRPQISQLRILGIQRSPYLFFAILGNQTLWNCNDSIVRGFTVVKFHISPFTKKG